MSRNGGRLRPGSEKERLGYALGKPLDSRTGSEDVDGSKADTPDRNFEEASCAGAGGGTDRGGVRDRRRRASAGPARFVYEACDSALPGGGTTGVKYTQNPGVAFQGSNTCAQPGGGLGISETGHVDATFAFWVVPTPVTPGGTIESIAISGSACGMSAGNTWFISQQGWPPSSCTESQHLVQGPLKLGLPSWIFLGCDGNHSPGCDSRASIFAHYIAATENDPTPPSVSNLRGSLFAGGVLHGRQTIGADLADKGGGLSGAELLVNGISAGEPLRERCNLTAVNNPSVRGLVAMSATPCPSRMCWREPSTRRNSPSVTATT